MANEATLFVRTAHPIAFTVPNGVGIEKGELVKLIDPFTVSGSVAIGDMAGGVAASEKIASDGKTKLGIYREGVFKVMLSGACIIGDALGFDTVKNYVRRATATGSGSRILGIALETGADGESILMELKPQVSPSV